MIYDNQLDVLVASQITASTEETLYEAVQVLDERLTTQWQTTTPTSQTIVFDAGGTVSGGDGQAMFQATTNLISDPEDWTTANWTDSGLVTSVDTTIVGVPAMKLSNDATTGGAFVSIDVPFTATNVTVLCTVRYGNADTPQFLIFDASTATVLGRAEITFSTKTVAYTASALSAMLPVWIDDRTVQVFMKLENVVPGNTNSFLAYPRRADGAPADYTWFSAPQAVDNTYPLGYTATTRAAWTSAGSVTHSLPPSGKFIVDCEFTPYFDVESTQFHRMWEWNVSSTKRLRCLWTPGADYALGLAWQDGGTQRTIRSSAFDSGTARTINQTIRIVSSIDLNTEATTGTRLFIIPRTQGGIEEKTSWSDAIDAFTTTTLTTLQIGAVTPLDGYMKHLRIYGPTFDSTDTITTEEELDDILATKTLTYSSDYAKHFDVEVGSILGHDISPEADILFELNDWDEWNYTDGSGSSIIQNTMTWNEDNILTFLSSRVKRKYARFSINDPNNDAGVISVGRIWLGEYLDISPSSLLNFRVGETNSDRVINGINQQKWADEGVNWRTFELQFPRMIATAKSVLEKVRTMYRTVGNAHSLIFCNFDIIRDYPIVEPVYCTIQGDINFSHRRSQKYEWAISLKEEL